MSMAHTVTQDQVRAARLVAALANTWGRPVPPTLREIAGAEPAEDPESQRVNGHTPPTSD
jgi:hypothetical protein